MTDPRAHKSACRDCRAFEGRPAALELSMPTLAALSSAHGANCADDGLCLTHERYVRASATCPSFARVTALVE